MVKITLLPVALAVLFAGCSGPTKAPDVAESVRTSLQSHGLSNVSVDQDRDKGVVTLKGTVASDEQKATAASVAQSIAPNQVVANEVIVAPPGMENHVEAIHDALDDGIESNMKAMMLRTRTPSTVNYKVNAGVVRLSGSVTSEAERSDVEKAAAGVANVKQVVNELQIDAQRATSTTGSR